MMTPRRLVSVAALACAGGIFIGACTTSNQDPVEDSSDEDGVGGEAGAEGSQGGAAGDAAGQGGSQDDDAGGSGGSGGVGSGGAAGQNSQTGGVVGNGGAGGSTGGVGGSSGGAGGNAKPAAPESLWVNSVLEWRNGAGWAKAINVQKQLPNLSDPATRYAAGKTQVRLVVEEVSGPTSLDTCFGHNKHGWDYSTCINCTGEITKAGTIECQAELAFCFTKGRAAAGCHGAPASATLSEGPAKETKHILLKHDADLFTSETRLLDYPSAATPFKAKFQIVFVPAGQEFSGWKNYPLPQ